MSGDTPDLDDLAATLLGNPDGIVVHWIIVARIEGADDTTSVITATDTSLDVVTHLGLATAAMRTAHDRFDGLHEPDDDEDSDE